MDAKICAYLQLKITADTEVCEDDAGFTFEVTTKESLATVFHALSVRLRAGSGDDTDRSSHHDDRTEDGDRLEIDNMIQRLVNTGGAFYNDTQDTLSSR